MKLIALKKTLSVRSTFSQRSNADESKAAASVSSKRSNRSFKRLTGGGAKEKEKNVDETIKETLTESSSSDKSTTSKAKTNTPCDERQGTAEETKNTADDDEYYIPWFAGKDGEDIKIIHAESSSKDSSKERRFGVAKSASTIDTDPLLQFQLSSFSKKASGESTLENGSSISSASSMGSGQFNLTSLAKTGGYNSECFAEQLQIKREASRSALASVKAEKKNEKLVQKLGTPKSEESTEEATEE